jgi:hypothetical protein
MSRVNARLNRSAAEFRAGDLLDPVGTERFDLAVSQPPYVVRPPSVTETRYLHGGARGDELALRFAAALPAALRDGGRAVLLFDSLTGEDPLVRRVRGTIGPAPVDLVVLASPGPSPDLQAVGYASIEDGTLGERYDDALRRYRDHLEGLGAKAFTRALVILVRSGVPGGRMDVELPVGGLSAVDAAALDGYLAGLSLASAPEPVLLRAIARPSPHARLCEERGLARPEAPPTRSIRFAPGHIGKDRELSEAGAFLLEALATSATIEESIARFAEATDSGPDEVGRTVTDFVREALSRGLLVRG